MDSMRRGESHVRRALGLSALGWIGHALIGLFVAALLFGDVGTSPAAEKKRGKAKQKSAERVEPKPIDVSEVWRESEVFSATQLVKLEPILRASTCTNEKVGCPYLDNGRAGSEARFAFRLIPLKVSRHRSYLVRNDRCGAGGCDQGLFVQIDGQWRLVAEMFGTLQRQSSTTLGFNDLVVHPRGQPPVHLVWDGQAYREAGR